jgi:hypothetical protein
MASKTIDVKSSTDASDGQAQTYLLPNYPGPPQPYPGPPVGSAVYSPQVQPAVPTNQGFPYAYAPLIPPPDQQQQQQQQQQQTGVVFSSANPNYTIVQQVPIESYCGYQAFGCFVFWCCNWLFGLIAWVLALTADNTKYTDREQARRLGKASLGMSISGIIVTIIIIAIIIATGGASGGQ